MAELLDSKYLTLTLDGERYALPVGRVREVLEYERATRLPCAASYMKGIINLRGQGVPVLDLRERFGLSATEAAKDTAIVVAEARSGEGARLVGLLADAVHEVVEIAPELMERAPGFGAGASAEFVRGVGRIEGGFVLALDLDRIFEDEVIPEPSAV